MRISSSRAAQNRPFAYDPAYRLKTLTDGNNHAFSHSYDLKGNLTQFSHPLANVSKHFDIATGMYDNDDNLKQITDGNNQTFNYALAPDDSRLTDIQYPANTLPTTHLDYDAYGRVIHTTNQASNYAYSYDDLDNLLDLNQFANNTAQTPLAHFYGMVYDAVGNWQSMTMQIVPYVTTDASGYASWTYDTIDKQSQLTSEGISHNNLPGPQGQSSTVSDYYTSDAADNLIQIRNTGYLGFYNPDNQFTFGSYFDGNGNTKPGGTYAYDANNRITGYNL